ncbi:aspartyl-phosphate phosphatase Spo0E family protein [Clostridium saccharoperbutylacetonicum]|uniref:aspartyl-phosphate phosphatase Spo0E family protein n=1 Tax=Clostridium saccharoperbutylacetonicum TaxID=36745 RepID=UPI0039EAFF73
MADLISYNIDMYRDMLHIAITNNKELTSDYILKLSQELDKAIVVAYKEQLNANNK